MSWIVTKKLAACRSEGERVLALPKHLQQYINPRKREINFANFKRNINPYVLKRPCTVFLSIVRRILVFKEKNFCEHFY